MESSRVADAEGLSLGCVGCPFLHGESACEDAVVHDIEGGEDELGSVGNEDDEDEHAWVVELYVDGALADDGDQGIGTYGAEAETGEGDAFAVGTYGLDAKMKEKSHNCKCEAGSETG